MIGSHAVLVYHAPGGRRMPQAVRAFARAEGLRVVALPEREAVLALVSRSYPAAIFMDHGPGDGCLELCRTLKSDTFSAIVPVIVLVRAGAEAGVLAALDAGADEVLTEGMNSREQLLRLRMTLQRAERDVSVHPTTRLPGTVQIERDIAERIRSGGLFAVCYADLDHFKEFNDRYGYNEGDRVILVVSRILRDIVKAYAPSGFIGHIGGDDFIFIVPLDRMRRCCEEVLALFDELIPYQYSEEDRRAGFFLARDRQGTVRPVPVMTLSIGVVTNQHRHFTHTARVSELATEMKSYAKTLPGSVYAVDRRADRPKEDELAAAGAPGSQEARPSP